MSNVSRRIFVTSTISLPISLSLTGTSFVQANDENDEFWYVSSEFRETLYSGSMEDTYAGLKWLRPHADELGVNPKNLAVLGVLIHPEQLETLAFKYDHLKKTLGINQTQKSSNI
ncbi:hypothetical protein PMI30_04996 [Pseudomonas sp. GM50]|uniref:hypothetical protein n=1 Tax=Pseudomonas sp. GM50 TaxID=1144332 RepID=UPI000270691C|nr:hypothetical protein [Pseudomonas sp. GM50]EJM61858.1 hypothetical protein PMI30_04996 [Pseudomonas sp. GM50]